MSTAHHAAPSGNTRPSRTSGPARRRAVYLFLVAYAAFILIDSAGWAPLRHRVFGHVSVAMLVATAPLSSGAAALLGGARGGGR